MKEYYYSIFGMCFKCNFKIEQVIEAEKDCKIDVEVRIAEMPQHIIDSIEKKKIEYSYKEDEYWFYMKRVGVFRIYNKKYIDIAPAENADEEEIKSYLLSAGFFLLAAQRRIVMLHGGVININNGAVIITGDCGAGKSTLVTEFILNGYKYIADDVGLVNINKGIVEIKPGYPQQKLCRDTAKKFGYDLNELIYIDEERDKFAVRSREHFLYKTLPLKAIFEVVENHNISNVVIEKINGVNKIKCIIDNLYERDICKYIGLEEKYFNVLIKIAKEIPYYKIYRPADLFTANEQMQLINKIVI